MRGGQKRIGFSLYRGVKIESANTLRDVGLNRDPELIHLLNCIEPNIIEKIVNNLPKKP